MAESRGETITITLQAAVDMTAKRWHFVRHSAANVMNQASNAADSAIAGVLIDDPNTGQFGAVRVVGGTKVVCGSSISVNALITSNGSGRATACLSGQPAFGRALEAASNDGDVISAILYGGPGYFNGV